MKTLSNAMLIPVVLLILVSCAGCGGNDVEDVQSGGGPDDIPKKITPNADNGNTKKTPSNVAINLNDPYRLVPIEYEPVPPKMDLSGPYSQTKRELIEYAKWALSVLIEKDYDTWLNRHIGTGLLSDRPHDKEKYHLEMRESFDKVSKVINGRDATIYDIMNFRYSDGGETWNATFAIDWPGKGWATFGIKRMQKVDGTWVSLDDNPISAFGQSGVKPITPPELPSVRSIAEETVRILKENDKDAMQRLYATEHDRYWQLAISEARWDLPRDEAARSKIPRRVKSGLRDHFFGFNKAIDLIDKHGPVTFKIGAMREPILIDDRPLLSAYAFISMQRADGQTATMTIHFDESPRGWLIRSWMPGEFKKSD